VVADSDGYIQAAHQGTLFLDEVAELHAAVQAKLLRVLETREVLAVGAVRAQPVELRVCSASHRSLSAEVAAGRLREDLYYRIGRPSERVPPLRERPEEIPWLIQTELKKGHPGLSAHVSLVEACVLRHWPGNIRELLVEIRAAAHEATTAGSGRIKAEHLAEAAGQSLKEPSPARAPAPSGVPQPDGQSQRAESAARPRKGTADRPNRAQIVAALLEAKCNVSEAARQLGLHRNQLRRRITQHSIDLDRLRGVAG
jgi:transcriptional regulator with PAS, ATPase and Fis domain